MGNILKKNIIIVFFLIISSSNINSEPLEEYNELVNQMNNYNIPGYFIIYNDEDDILWQQGRKIHTGMPLDIVPANKGLFQFQDPVKNELCYRRWARLIVNAGGLLCNSDGFPLFPFIKVDITKEYKIIVNNHLLKIMYDDEYIDYTVNLYWPDNITQNIISSVYFYFKEVSVVNNDIITGFIEYSATHIQESIVKMIILIPLIEECYKEKCVFKSGSANTSLLLLSSLLAASYSVDLEKEMYNSLQNNEQIDVEFSLPEFPGYKSISSIPKYSNYRDPLKLNGILKYLIITIE
jgi:hypothetical protein